MLFEIEIQGFAELRLAHLVLDFNGTLAEGGRLVAADLVVPGIVPAPDLFRFPLRLAAALRN